MNRYITLLCLLIGISQLNGQNGNFELKIIAKKHLTKLPSASGIEIIDGSLFVIGDDSPYLFKLNNEFETVDKYLLTGNKKTKNNRVSKATKSDFESIATYLNKEGRNFLAILSSGSKAETRDTIHIFSLSDNKKIASKNMRPLYETIREKAGFSAEDEINIEAFAIGKTKVFLMQRGNNNDNILIIMGREEFLNYVFKTNSAIPSIEITSFILPSVENTTAGFSGACMLKDESGLLFVSSLEATSNAYDDGEILGSYIGILKFNESNHEIETQILKQDGEVVKTKLEGIAIKSKKDNIYLLVAVSDNDDGTSMIFNIELKF